MLDWTNAKKNAFQSGVQKYVTLEFSGGTVIDNELIQTESLSFTQTICDESELRYGLCYASEFTIVVFSVDEVFEGQTVTVSIEADGEDFTLGTFIVATSPLSDDRTYRTITAYDPLYSILTVNYADWVTQNISFPITLKDFRDSFFEYVGIEQVTTTLVNDSFEIILMDTGGTISGCDIMNSIGELNGVFGLIGYDGKLKWVSFQLDDGALYPALDIYPLATEYPTGSIYYTVPDGEYVEGSLVYAEGAVDAPTKVVYTNDSGVKYEYGQDGTDYVMGENLFLNTSTSTRINTAITNLYGKIAGISYVPATVKLRSAPWVEPGDAVFVMSRFDDEVIFPVMSRTISGITGLMESFTATGNGNYRNSPNSVTEKRRQALQYGYMALYSISITPSNVNFTAGTCDLTATVYHSGNEITDLGDMSIVWSDGVLGATRTGVDVNEVYTATLERG